VSLVSDETARDDLDPDDGLDLDDDDVLDDLGKDLGLDADLDEDVDAPRQPERPAEGSEADEAWLASLNDEDFDVEFRRRQEANAATIDAELAAQGKERPQSEPDVSTLGGLSAEEMSLAYSPSETDDQIAARLDAQDKQNAELARQSRIRQVRELKADLQAKAEARLRPAPDAMTPAEAAQAELDGTAFARMSGEQFRAFMAARDAGKTSIIGELSDDEVDQTYRRVSPKAGK
jgi:hypothetical protein